MLVWACAGAVALFALMRLLGLERGYPLVPIAAFAPWVAIAAAITVALAGALRRWWPAAVAAAAGAVLVALVLPRAFGEPTAAVGSPGPALRVLAANVSFGQAHADDLVQLASELDADALVVTELTPRFAATLRRAGVDRLLPHTALAAEPNARGTGIYSRLRLAGRGVEHLPGSGFAMPHARLVVPGAQAVRLAGVHAAPPTSVGAWAEDLEALPPPESNTVTILAGDFNATLDHAEFREVLDRGYADAAETLGQGLTFTWPTNRRIPPLVAIDHVIADARIGVRAFSAHDLDGTDHRAAFAELQLPAG